MLQAVVRDAHEPDTERDRRIPRLVDDAVEVDGTQPREVRRGPRVDRVEVGDQVVGPIGADRRNVGGGVTVAMVGGVWLEPEAGGPVAGLPQLGFVEELGDVVVLHACEVPDQPSDRVRVGGSAAKLLTGQAVDRLAREWRDPTVDLDQEGTGVHASSSSHLRARCTSAVEGRTSRAHECRVRSRFAGVASAAEADVDPWSEANLRDPFPLYAELRGLGPVVRLTRHDMYAVTRYIEIR
jgi:hypothetical protein